MSDNLPALRPVTKTTGVSVTTIDEAYRLGVAVVKSGLAPSSLNTPEKCMVAILHGLELGLPPMMSINKIAVINGRPSIWGDAVPALLWSRGFKIEETVSEGVATCTVTRPTGEKTTRHFCESDARKAGLWGKAGPWTQHPNRMLAMRARGFAARDGAADVLSGLYLQEELEGGELTNVVNIETRKSSAEAKRDGTKDTFDVLMKAIEDAPEATALLSLRADHAEEWAKMPSRWATLLNESYFYKAKDFGVIVDTETGQIVEDEAPSF